MIVASIDPGTGQVALFQVPARHGGRPGARATPAAPGSSVYRDKINSWFTQNRNRTDLWPGKTAQARGFASLKAILGELYGLDIRYYVMVNFDGLHEASSTRSAGSRSTCRSPSPRAPTRTTVATTSGSTFRRGPQHMTGAQALIYARSRHGSNDFDRGLRQQRVLVSLRDQMSAQAIIANLPALVDALKGSVKTDIKTSDLPKLLALAESVDTKNIRSFNFAPPYFATDMWGPSRGTNSDLVINVAARPQAAPRAAFGVLACGNPWNLAAVRALDQALAEAGGADWLLAGSVLRAFDAEHALRSRPQRLEQVPEVADFYDAVGCVLVPNTGGTGLKIKTVEALMSGRPVLGTAHAFAGLPADAPGACRARHAGAGRAGAPPCRGCALPRGGCAGDAPAGAGRRRRGRGAAGRAGGGDPGARLHRATDPRVTAARCWR